VIFCPVIIELDHRSVVLIDEGVIKLNDILSTFTVYGFN